MPFRTPTTRNYFHPKNGFSDKVIGVYRIFNRVSGKSYIGQGCGSEGVYGRWYDHLKNLNRGTHNAKFQAAWNKYRKSDWVFGILEICEPCKTMLDQREKYWMEFYNAVERGYNISPTPSTTLGFKMSVEQRARMSEAQKKRFQKPGEKEKISPIGRKHTEETKEKIRVNNLGKNTGKPSCNKGVPLSEERKKKLSLAKTGVPFSEIARHKLKNLPKKIWIKKNGECRRVTEECLEDYLSEGWQLGRVIIKRGF